MHFDTKIKPLLNKLLHIEGDRGNDLIDLVSIYIREMKFHIDKVLKIACAQDFQKLQGMLRVKLLS